MQVNNMNEYSLVENNGPRDAVSCIQWVSDSPDELSFLVGCYDGCIFLYQTHNETRKIYRVWDFEFEASVTAIEVKNLHIFVGLGNGKVLLGMLKNSDFQLIGQHDGPVCRLTFINQLFSFGVDKKMLIYDLHENTQIQIDLEHKTFAVGYNTNHFIVGSQDFSVVIISTNDDIDYQKRCLKRPLKQYLLKKENPNDEIRCLSYCNDEKIIRVGTMKGYLFSLKIHENRIKFVGSSNSQKSDLEPGMISDIETGYDIMKGRFTIFAGTYQSQIVYESERQT